MGPSKATSAERLMPQATEWMSPTPSLTAVIWGKFIKFIKQSLKLHSLTYLSIFGYFKILFF